MKLWSKGLGRTEVTMDFRYYQVIKDKESGSVIVIGNMQDPVTWEFTMKMEPNDIAGILKILLSWHLLWFVVKNLFRYPLYLFKRKEFALEGREQLEQKVMSAYRNSTTKKGRKKRRKPRETTSVEQAQVESQTA